MIDRQDERGGMTVTVVGTQEGAVLWIPRGRFTVDGIAYIPPDGSRHVYIQPMIVLKETSGQENWDAPHISCPESLEALRKRPEWRDLAWDPGIRL